MAEHSQTEVSELSVPDRVPQENVRYSFSRFWFGLRIHLFKSWMVYGKFCVQPANHAFDWVLLMNWVQTRSDTGTTQVGSTWCSQMRLASRVLVAHGKWNPHDEQ